MKKSPQSKISAMTLTELLIASALVGVVMIGALSADAAIRTWQKRIEQRTMVQMDLARAMEQILRDGKATVGHGVIDITGIPTANLNDDAIHFVINPNTGGALSFRQNNTYIVYTVYFIAGPDQRRILMRCVGTDPDRPCTEVLALSPELPKPNFFRIHSNGIHVTSIEIQLTTRFNPSVISPANPLTNPEHTLTTHFFPPGVSQ